MNEPHPLPSPTYFKPINHPRTEVVAVRPLEGTSPRLVGGVRGGELMRLDRSVRVEGGRQIAIDRHHPVGVNDLQHAGN